MTDPRALSVRFAYPAAACVLAFAGAFAVARIVSAATPNPGHPWTEVGDGTFVVTGPTAARTYSFPDANATVLTSAAAVTVAQGGTGATTLTGVLIGTGTGAVTAAPVLGSANGGTGSSFVKLSGPAASEKTFTLPDQSAGILTDAIDVTLAQGGTGATLTASNGGILYSNASNVTILGGTATAGQVLRSGASGAPSWSTATYPAAAGTSGNVLTSDGTNWTSASAATFAQLSVLTRPHLATGAIAAVAASSLTSRSVGLFTVDQRLVINQLTFNVGTVTTAGTMRVCLYAEDGSSKSLDVVSGTVVAGNNTVSVVPAVTLAPGNYYVAIGCATTCSDTVQTFTSTAAAWVNGASIPSGERAYEGTVTHASGACNSTLGTVTGSNSRTPVIRLDN